MYFLDTNIITYLRYGDERIKARLDALPPDSYFVSGIVVEEIIVRGFIAEINNIRSGKSKASIQRTYDDFHLAIKHLARFRLVPYTSDAEAIYKTFKAAKLKGFDGRIAAHALALDFVLVTENVRDFEIVAGLTVEDWTRA